MTQVSQSPAGNPLPYPSYVTAQGPDGSQDAVYTLKQDDAEAQRLDKQHKACKILTGGLVPESIWNDLKSRKGEVRIADLATGTGLWLVDLDRELQAVNINARLEGFDITDAKFPQPHELVTNGSPSNIQLSVLDVLEPVQPEMVGAFDYIHLRMLMMAVQEDKHQVVLESCMQMLKPGGYIHWEDLTSIDSKIQRKEHKDIAMDAYDELLDKVFSKVMEAKNLPQDGAYQVSALIKSLGFEDCADDTFNSTESTHAVKVALNESMFQGMGDVCMLAITVPALKETVQSADPSMTLEKVERLIREMKAGYENGVYFNWFHHSVHGRKSMN